MDSYVFRFYCEDEDCLTRFTLEKANFYETGMKLAPYTDSLPQGVDVSIDSIVGSN